MLYLSGIQGILDTFGEHASIIDADPFPKLIRAAFSDIPQDKVGHALLYNISMETVDTAGKWPRFQDVWLDTYSEREDIETVNILLPVEAEKTFEPCPWTCVSGLTTMVENYEMRVENKPRDLPRLSKLCRKTNFSVVPYKKAEKATAGVYAFCLYIVLPKTMNLFDLLKRSLNEDTAVQAISKEVKLILGAGIDSPYSERPEAPSRQEYAYKFIIVIPQVKDIAGKKPSIIEEHVKLYARLWSDRVPLRVRIEKKKLSPELSFLRYETYSNPTQSRCSPLDFAFLWYHFFFNKETRKSKKSCKKVKKDVLMQGRQFVEDVRGGFAGTITDSSLKEKIGPLLAESAIKLNEKRRVGGFVMATDESWGHVNKFLCYIRKIIDLMNEGKAFGQKQVGFCIWGRPSSGKSFLVQEWASQLEGEKVIKFMPLPRNLPLNTCEEVKAWVSDVQEASRKQTVLAFVDEVDKIGDDCDVYKDLFLLPSVVEDERPGKVIFLVAGSSGRTIEDMVKEICSKKAGKDLFERTKVDKFSFPSHLILDRLYIATARILRTSEGKILQAELLGLLTLAASPLYSVSDIDNRIDDAVRESLKSGENRIAFHRMFLQPESERQQFEESYPTVYASVKNVVVDIQND